MVDAETPKIAGRAELTVERSRFLAVFAAIASDEEMKLLLDGQRRAQRKARHHCWACRYLDAGGRLTEQARDDGEVGRPGTKMLELLRRHELYGALVVSRLFGGIKLGPGHVGRAFAEVARQALGSVVGVRP